MYIHSLTMAKPPIRHFHQGAHEMGSCTIFLCKKGKTVGCLEKLEFSFEVKEQKN